MHCLTNCSGGKNAANIVDPKKEIMSLLKEDQILKIFSKQIKHKHHNETKAQSKSIFIGTLLLTSAIRNSQKKARNISAREIMSNYEGSCISNWFSVSAIIVR
jgi:hypothetical protein